MGVMTEPTGTVGEGFICAGKCLPIKDHAGGAGIHQTPDAVLAAGRHHVPRAQNVGLIKTVPVAPDARFGSDVKDRVHARAGGRDRCGVGEVAGMACNAQRFQFRLGAASKTPHRVTAR